MGEVVVPYLTDPRSPEGSALGAFLNAGVAERKGEAAVAAQQMQAAMSRVSWDKRRPVYAALGWSIYLDDAMPVGGFYVDKADKRIMTGTETWDILSYESRAKYSLIEDLKEGASGTKIMPLTAGPLLDAIRAKSAAQAEGSSTTVEVIDRLGDMRERAQKIVQAATSMNEPGVSNLQRKIFHVRFAELMDEWATVQAEVARVAAVIDMAVDAV